MRFYSLHVRNMHKVPDNDLKGILKDIKNCNDDFIAPIINDDDNSYKDIKSRDYKQYDAWLTFINKNDLINQIKTELNGRINKDLNEKVKYLEKKTKREEKLVSNLKTKILNLKQEISENKKDFQEENEKLDNLIIQQKKDLKSNQNIIADLRKEVEEKIKAEELLNKWGYEDKYENNIVIISYEESSLYKLFFGDYIFINSNKRADNIVEKILQVDNNYIIINKAKLSTKKLLEIENVIDSNLKINLLSYTPKDFTIKIIKKLEEENFNIL